MQNLKIPKDYKNILSLRQTHTAIEQLKAFFEKKLSKAINLNKISSPLFLSPKTGLNDNLNGTEQAVSFYAPNINNEEKLEIVHSLAKWKRLALKTYSFQTGEGIITHMHAIRREEVPTNLHSIYVDQWDWERIIEASNRNLDFLKKIVREIYEVLKKTETYILSTYPDLGSSWLPKDIFFITSEELLNLYPNLTPKHREDAITKEHGAVFLMQIGDVLSNGEKHDKRAPDYDDWQLNGDILLWYPPLDCAFEISSMGIRVDANSMKEQLEKAKRREKEELTFHQMILNNELPLSIGGGIGQSRVCMYFLRKIHIGQVQTSTWPLETIETLKAEKIEFLL